MDIIRFNTEWRYQIAEVPLSADDKLSFVADQWNLLNSEIFRMSGGFILLWQTFEMPPNDFCATWWLELVQPLNGQVWINRIYVGELSTERLEITKAVSLGSNQILLNMSLPLLNPIDELIACVPYPCI